ncbi:MAG: AMIN domain-containing protein, partial [Sphingomonadaceae bacterium]
MGASAMLARLFVLLLLLAPAPALAQAVAGALAIAPDGNGARVRLALSRPLEGTATSFVLDNPRRLVIDLPGVATQRREAGAAGPVRMARIAQFDPATARLVLDMAQPLALRAARMAEGPVLELEIGPATEAELAAAGRRGRTAIPMGGSEAAVLAEVEAALSGRQPPPLPAIT